MICFQRSFLNISSFSGIGRTSFQKFPSNQPLLKSQLHVLRISSNFNYNDALDMKNNRQKVNLPLDSIILELQSTEASSDFLKFCFLNRDNISYILLYQLTALKLKGEEGENNIFYDNKIIDLRKKILENIQIIDQPITQSLIVSEKLVKEILQQDRLSPNFDSIIKKDKININSLWIVLTAAISAWENKIKYGKDEISETTLEKLVEIKRKVFQDERFYPFLGKELALIDSFNFSNTTINTIDVEIGLIDGFKLLICILEKLPKSSYGILLHDVSVFYDNLLQTKLGIQKKSVTGNMIQFFPKKIATDSRLVNIKEKNFKN